MKAWQLIEKPENWTTRAPAKDLNDKEVSVYSPQACKWCTWGAVTRCYGVVTQFAILHILQKNCFPSIGSWNDYNTHEVVLAKLKELDI